VEGRLDTENVVSIEYVVLSVTMFLVQLEDLRKPSKLEAITTISVPALEIFPS
jgi:hypothetical protein